MSLFEPTVVESKASRIRWGTIHEGEPLSGIWSKEVTVPHHVDALEMLAGECISPLLPQNTREICSGKLRQFNSCALPLESRGAQIFLTLRYGPRILNWCLINSDSSSLEHKGEYNLIQDVFSLKTKNFKGLIPSSKHCQMNFSTSWSSTNICNKVVFSMPLLHDLRGNRYGFNSNRCIMLAMILWPSACLPSNPSYCITSEVARTVSILKHVVSITPA